MKSTGDNGQRNFVALKKSGVGSEMGALVEKSDISIAHRLPGRNSKARPMIVRFCRRISKEELLRNYPNFVSKKFETNSTDELSRSFRRPNNHATQVFQPYERRRQIRIYLDKRKE